MFRERRSLDENLDCSGERCLSIGRFDSDLERKMLEGSGQRERNAGVHDIRYCSDAE